MFSIWISTKRNDRNTVFGSVPLKNYLDDRDTPNQSYFSKIAYVYALKLLLLGIVQSIICLFLSVGNNCLSMAGIYFLFYWAFVIAVCLISASLNS